MGYNGYTKHPSIIQVGGGGGSAEIPQETLQKIDSTAAAVDGLNNEYNQLTGKVDDAEAAIEDLGLNVKKFPGSGGEVNSLSIQSAIAFAGTTRRKKVFVPGGDYTVTSTIVIEDNIELHLAPDATLYAGADVNIVNVKPNGKMTGGKIDCTQFDNFTKACVFMNGDDIYMLLNDHVYVEDTLLMGKDHEYTDQAWTGKGIHLYSGIGSAGNPSYVSFTKFRNMGIYNFEYGIVLETDESITQEDNMAWVNGNTFDNISMMNCPKGITLIGDSQIPRDCSGNSFDKMQIQVNSYSDWAINIIGGGWNEFRGTWWDLHRQPSGAKGFIFGADTRFNTIYGMHGYESRHWKDDGYMNRIVSPTNHIPDNKYQFRPLSAPYKPNAYGNQDDFLANAHKRGITVTQVTTTDPARQPDKTLPLGRNEHSWVLGDFDTLFTLDNLIGVTWDATDSDYDNPIVLEVDCSAEPIPYIGFLGIHTPYDGYPKNALFEVSFDGTNYVEFGDWLVDNTESNFYASAPWAAGETVQKIRISMWESNREDGEIHITRLYATSTTKPGEAFLAKEGGDMHGPLNAKGGFIVETRTDDPTSPVDGQMWLRTDL